MDQARPAIKLWVLDEAKQTEIQEANTVQLILSQMQFGGAKYKLIPVKNNMFEPHQFPKWAKENGVQKEVSEAPYEAC